MKDINIVTMTGRLTADPVFRSTQGGYSFLNFSIACNSVKKDGDSWVDEAHFFDCEIGGKRADGLNGKLLKGEAVTIQGKLKLQRWESDGQKRQKVIIWVDEIIKQYVKKTENQPSIQSSFNDLEVPF